MATTQAPPSMTGAAATLPAPPRDALMAHRGIVASANAFASEAGLDVLRRGGNAVDAAIAAAAVLFCVEPRNGHLGGDTFMQVAQPDGTVTAINGSGAAPAAATLAYYQSLGGIPESGLLSAVVPGTVSAWALAAEQFGTRPFGELLAPAIWYAEHGVPVTPRLNKMLTSDAPLYRANPDAARVFVPNGAVPAIGETLRQPDLARSLARIADGGRDAFYCGDLTEEMVRASARYGGLFTQADFAAHRSEAVPPLAITYRGYTIHAQPPPSQGIIVLMALKTLEQFDFDGIEPGSAAAMHLHLSALALAFADRMRYLGDPWHAEMPLEWLLSEGHARQQAARIAPDRALAAALPPQVQPDTTSLVAADAGGTLVAYIHSLYSGAGVVLGGTGALMNSRLLGFNLEPGHPNCLAPGKRPVHTLNTYVVAKDGVPLLVGGTPGAHWQVQTNVQILTNVLDWGMDLPDAIAAPRFTVGDQFGRDTTTVTVEARAGEATLGGLRALGYAVEPIGPWASGGAVQLIARDPRTGLLRGTTEIRRPDGAVVGW